MPSERLSMRKIRDVLRLKFEGGLSERVIARSLSLSNGSVNSYLQRARVAGLRWPLADDLDDAALELLLFPPAPARAAPARPAPDWAVVDKELRRKASPCRCCGKSIAPRIRTGSATVGSASNTARSSAGCVRACGRATPPARRCSSISRATRSTHRPGDGRSCGR